MKKHRKEVPAPEAAEAPEAKAREVITEAAEVPEAKAREVITEAAEAPEAKAREEAAEVKAMEGTLLTIRTSNPDKPLSYVLSVAPIHGEEGTVGVLRVLKQVDKSSNMKSSTNRKTTLPHIRYNVLHCQACLQLVNTVFD